MKSRIKVLYLFFPNEKHTGVDSEQCGVCGKESDIVDVNGNKLCVGDVVEYSHCISGKGYVIERCGEIYISGLYKVTENPKRLKEWNVRKVKGFEETLQNERYGFISTKLKKRHVVKKG